MDVMTTSPQDRPRILADGTIVYPSKKPKDDFPTQNQDQTSSSAPPKQVSKPPDTNPPRRFAPQLIETTTKNSNDAKNKGKSKDRAKTWESKNNHMPPKFAPQLISTAKRSFRQDKALYPGQQYKNHMKTSRPRSTGGESRYSYASLVRRYEAKRRPSFQVPDLPVIESHSSDESPHSPDSSSTSPSIPPKRGHSKEYPELPPAELANQRTAAFFMNQALAAYPNERVHQPVSHFAIDRADEDSPSEDELDNTWGDVLENLTAFRRGSTVDLGWELEELRHHKHEAEMRERDRKFAQGHSKFSAASLAAKQSQSLEWRDGMIDGWAKNAGIHLDRAESPPMLGGDIVFVRCQSPESFLRETESEGGSADREDRDAANDPGLWSCDRQGGSSSDGGLWHGYCKQSYHEEPESKTGLATPAPTPSPRLGIVTPAVVVNGKELGLPFRTMKPSVEVKPPNQLPPKPGDDGKVVRNMDGMLTVEAEVQKEFNDGFITQIYNYLSLGFPCLAWDYDEELSKISGIPIGELRKDDAKLSELGHLPAPGASTKKTDSNDGEVAKSVRWTALKLYLHEWARQQPRMAEEDTAETWGAHERRGSWGI